MTEPTTTPTPLPDPSADVDVDHLRDVANERAALEAEMRAEEQQLREWDE